MLVFQVAVYLFHCVTLPTPLLILTILHEYNENTKMLVMEDTEFQTELLNTIKTILHFLHISEMVIQSKTLARHYKPFVNVCMIYIFSL